MGLERARFGGRGVVVTRDDDGVAAAVVARLEAAGLAARVVDQPEAASEAEGVIYLGGLMRDAGADAALESARSAFAFAHHFAQRRQDDDVAPGFFVTVQDTGGDFGLAGSERAYHGALAGLSKTADLEWSKVGVKAIDVERGERSADAQAEAIVEELLAGGPEIEVGLHVDGRRTTLKSELRSIVSAGSPKPGPSSVLVCSGGARGVTAATLVALARASQPRIALLGRTPLSEEPSACAGVDDDAGLKRALLMAAKAAGQPVKPAELGRQVKQILAVREIRATLAALQEAGSEASYHSTDVADPVAVQTALAEVRAAWGPITGIVHGAGVLADKLIADKTRDQFDWVLKTKVGGLRALLDATASDPIDTLVMFSSVAARTGNVGQCDYAMANEILNKVAAAEGKRRPGCRVASLGWGPWEGGMVTPALKAYFESHGVPLIPLDVGAQMLVDELSVDADGVVEVVLGGPPRRASIAEGAVGGIAATAFDLLLQRERQPYLVDHTIEATPVLPAVMSLEWFARAAAAVAPERSVTAVEDLRVYKGIVLDGFDRGDWLRVMVEPTDQPNVLSLTLVDPTEPNRKRYGARVVLGERGPSPAAPAAPADGGDVQGPLYGDSLFHGPAFQVIRRVDGVGDSGIVADLDGLQGRGWPTEAWATDPAALDGALQLAVRWAQDHLGGRGLPTAIGALRLFTGELSQTGPWRVTCRTHVDGPGHLRSDIAFVADDRVVATLEGVETHQRP